MRTTDTRDLESCVKGAAAVAGLQLVFFPCCTVVSRHQTSSIHRKVAPVLTESHAKYTALLFRSNQIFFLHPSPPSLPSKCKGFLFWGATFIKLPNMQVQFPSCPMEVLHLQLANRGNCICCTIHVHGLKKSEAGAALGGWSSSCTVLLQEGLGQENIRADGSIAFSSSLCLFSSPFCLSKLFVFYLHL